jgi:predicted anti-sigma-YlaC factor YlaD
MLTCKELTELITNYLEGRQSFFERMRFELHLGMCRHCRAYLRQMKDTIETLGALPEEAIPPEVTNQLLERFRAWKR